MPDVAHLRTCGFARRVCRLVLVPGRVNTVVVGGLDAEGVPIMILPKVRDPRFVTIRRGGTLTDSDHRLLALWAASCAEHVLDLFGVGSAWGPTTASGH